MVFTHVKFALCCGEEHKIKSPLSDKIAVEQVYRTKYPVSVIDCCR